MLSTDNSRSIDANQLGFKWYAESLDVILGSNMFAYILCAYCSEGCK